MIARRRNPPANRSAPRRPTVTGSDAEEYVARRFPAKTIKTVHSGLRPRTIRQFLSRSKSNTKPHSAGAAAIRIAHDGGTGLPRLGIG